MIRDKEIFLSLIRAGLWEKDTRLLPYGKVNFEEVMRLAEEQSVIGLVTAGLEHVSDLKVPQEIQLQFVGQTIQLEQRNKEMNHFIAVLINKMRNAGIYSLLVKGQGVAQCYERPLWRACGDVDLFLSEENYKKAKDFLMPVASDVEMEFISEQHLGMTVGDYVVELHGTLHSGLSQRIEKGLDDIKRAAFYDGNVRSWDNDKTLVFLLRVDEDVVYVFTHILQHFYKGGIGLRQICDWCRLLWTFKSVIDTNLLESRLKTMGLMTEWKAFGAFAVEYLGMPADAVPLFGYSSKWVNKARLINEFIMSVGNMGNNRDKSYFNKYPYLIRKSVSMGRRFGDLVNHARIFPLDSLRFFPRIVFNGVGSAMRGE